MIPTNPPDPEDLEIDPQSLFEDDDEFDDDDEERD